MALKNFTRLELKKNDKSHWKLFDLNGDEVLSFNQWTLFIQDRFSFQTRDKYSQIVSKFLDYLFEINIYEKSVSRLEFKEAIENYKSLLANGKSITDKKLNDIAYILDFNKLKPASWSNNIAAINSFLTFVFEKEKDERDYIAIKNQIQLPESFKDLLSEISSTTQLNQFQKKSIKEKSYLANLYRNVGTITIQAGIKYKSKHINQNIDLLDFPSILIPDLLTSATSFRDRALYALLAGTGIRSSEALTLEWSDIDIDNQKVYINYKGFDEDMRFKGRDTKETYFIPELRVLFFKALYEYQLNEAKKDVNHNYVFQFLEKTQYGLPYYKVSRQSFIKEFKKTVKRIHTKNGILDDKIYTPHSLRHFYGVYMLNYIPNENGYGFYVEIVQKMMGHKSVLNTQKYAKRDTDYIKQQLVFAENNMELDLTKDSLNKLMNKKYQEIKFND